MLGRIIHKTAKWLGIVGVGTQTAKWGQLSAVVKYLKELDKDTEIFTKIDHFRHFENIVIIPGVIFKHSSNNMACQQSERGFNREWDYKQFEIVY